ncbi:3-ketoacyl-ACP reductase [Paraburkholderia youngii]|uniref:NAD(P)-dependent dehydrogenase (Short-subunit alcohol dehydrogenase family) n=1 Tax=Paraburkholderia youngii TaxID=2782701 RepID=A0A7W8P2W5_9BURK|nr:3-ketoacyl-ACP reductase [Paraburkholderia youngii]MBB5399538.1 NAD(P)-dependent dehydrogenase (short-subunit alcohol dehydrogenase family) [Paraburkholderia youngii]
MSKIAGKFPTALVTGARRGIGRSICVALARRGFDIVLTDVVNDEDAATTCALVRDEGQDALFIQSDLSDIASHDNVVEEAVRFNGSIDCLVNNAGIGSPSRGDLLDVSPQAFDAVLGVNLRGTFFMTQAVARHMDSTASSFARAIVTVSSVSAEMASTERAEYCLSKSALPMITRLFALRLAKANIGVFEVRPGIIRTPMTAGVAEKYEARFREGLVPAGRWGESDEVGQVVATLAGGLLPFGTGSVVNVDGGLSIPTF